MGIGMEIRECRTLEEEEEEEIIDRVGQEVQEL